MMYTMVYFLTFAATAYKVYRRWMYCAVRPCEKKTLDSGIYESSELEKLLLDGLKEEIQREIEKNLLKPIDKSI